REGHSPTLVVAQYAGRVFSHVCYCTSCREGILPCLLFHNIHREGARLAHVCWLGSIFITPENPAIKISSVEMRWKKVIVKKTPMDATISIRPPTMLFDLSRNVPMMAIVANKRPSQVVSVTSLKCPKSNMIVKSDATKANAPPIRPAKNSIDRVIFELLSNALIQTSIIIWISI